MVELAEEFGFGPRAHLGLDRDENSVGSWHDENTVGEGVEVEGCSFSPLALGKGKGGSLGPSYRKWFCFIVRFGRLSAQASKQGSQLLLCFPPQIVYL